jgi:hypothetical protein
MFLREAQKHHNIIESSPFSNCCHQPDLFESKELKQKRVCFFWWADSSMLIAFLMDRAF